MHKRTESNQYLFQTPRIARKISKACQNFGEKDNPQTLISEEIELQDIEKMKESDTKQAA